MKVFLVEDSLAIRERLAKMIGSIPGAEIVGHAGDVANAISGILAERPDVVVLDLKLVHGSGFEVLSAVHEREPGIDFYMLSNFATEPYRLRAAQLGALGFFDKSSEFTRVREVIAERAARTH